jgi:hypothetical protein
VDARAHLCRSVLWWQELMRVPASICPYCRGVFNGATVAQGDGKPPSPGDFAICIDCHLPSAYTETAERRPLTQVEADELRAQMART